MTHRFDDVPGWVFECEGIASGIYGVVGKDQDGHELRITGTNDPDAALGDLRERARTIDAEGKRR